jgi:phenylalanyl-tRNA synthetase alpha chain
MSDDLSALKTETEAALAAAADLREWDAVRVAVLGKNGKLTALLKDLGKAAPEQRRERGAALNVLKDALAQSIEARTWKRRRWKRGWPPSGSSPPCRRGRGPRG